MPHLIPCALLVVGVIIAVVAAAVWVSLREFSELPRRR